jgi:hypothetical protein
MRDIKSAKGRTDAGLADALAAVRKPMVAYGRDLSLKESGDEAPDEEGLHRDCALQ